MPGRAPLFIFTSENAMQRPICACLDCGAPLDLLVNWWRLVTVEPVLMEYVGPWGLPDWELVDGAQDVHVQCPRCGTNNSVGRDFPVAAA